MIVLPALEGLVLIRQPDHAALSERLMRAWQADGFPRRATRAAVLVAVREHDNGWLEPGRRPSRDGPFASDGDLLLAYEAAPAVRIQGEAVGEPEGSDR